MSARTSRRESTSRAGRRLFLAVTLSVPVLFFLLLELGLQLGGYGTDLRLFVTETVGGRTYRIMNPDVKGRYFSRVSFTPTTSYDLFTDPKEPGTFRVFLLGGSTTVGYPYGYIGSFSTFLRDRLRLLFPDRQFEIINLGMTATNSFTVLDIADELPEYEPDLIIVYDGHNEFYGALGMASRESVGRSRWLTRLYLSVIRFRTVQLVRSLLFPPADIGADARTGRGGPMMQRLAAGQYVPRTDPVYEEAAAAFDANLDDLAAVCREHRIPLILTTQVSNLRHQAPFVSLHSPGITAAESTLAARHADSAAARISSAPEETLSLLRAAFRADSAYAAAAFRYAAALDAAGRIPDARELYAHARDADALRFRTDRRFNGIIANHAGPGVAVVDAESVLAAHSPQGIVGRELILEHLHPAARGYFLIAAAYAQTMRRLGLVAPGDIWTERDTLDEDVLWQNRPLTALDELAARRRTELLVSGWPFRAVDATPPEPDPGEPLARIAEGLLSGKDTWEQAHVAAAQYYASVGDTAGLEREYRALINQLPQNVSAYLLLGRLWAIAGRPAEARALLRRSLVHEETATACRIIGGIDLQSQAYDSAAFFLERAFALSGPLQDRVESGYLLALALSRSAQTPRALSVLNSVLALNPGFSPAARLRTRLEGAGR